MLSPRAARPVTLIPTAARPPPHASMQAANQLKGIATLGAVNCDEHKALCSKHGVKGYPSIKAFVNGKLRDYAGERSTKAIYEWVLSQLPSYVTRVKDAAGLLQLLSSCGGAGSKKAGKGKASWDVCVVLLSDKSKTPPSYTALSNTFKGKVTFCPSDFLRSSPHTHPPTPCITTKLLPADPLHCSKVHGCMQCRVTDPPTHLPTVYTRTQTHRSPWVSCAYQRIRRSPTLWASLRGPSCPRSWRCATGT
jgi:hypothetical protein